MKGYRKVLELLELTFPTACAYLFKLRPGVLSNTLSHMWGKLYLPRFLFLCGVVNPNEYGFFNISS